MLSHVFAVPRAGRVRLDAPRMSVGSDVGELEAVRLTLLENEFRLVRVIWTRPELVTGMVREEGETLMEKSRDGLAPRTAETWRTRTRMSVRDARVRRVIWDGMLPHFVRSSSPAPLPRQYVSVFSIKQYFASPAFRLL